MVTKELRDAIIAIVIKKPGKEELTPEDLNESVERMAVVVSRYCRLRNLPFDLRYTLADIVSDTYDMLNPEPLQEDVEIDESRVKSIKQGDTTIELNVAAKQVCENVSDVVKKYVKDLAPYKGVFWR
nr:MAG TPA: tail connector protein [Caudoviricetes sp.]